MRKYLFFDCEQRNLRTAATVLFFLLCCTFATVQIRTEFLGLTLGKITRAEADNILLSRNEKWYQDAGDENCVYSENLAIDDYVWGIVAFKLENSRLVKVTLYNSIRKADAESLKNDSDASIRKMGLQRKTCQEISDRIRKNYNQYDQFNVKPGTYDDGTTTLDWGWNDDKARLIFKAK